MKGLPSCVGNRPSQVENSPWKPRPSVWLMFASLEELARTVPPVAHPIYVPTRYSGWLDAQGSPLLGDECRMVGDVPGDRLQQPTQAPLLLLALVPVDADPIPGIFGQAPQDAGHLPPRHVDQRQFLAEVPPVVRQ